MGGVGMGWVGVGRDEGHQELNLKLHSISKENAANESPQTTS